MWNRDKSTAGRVKIHVFLENMTALNTVVAPTAPFISLVVIVSRELVYWLCRLR